MSNSARPDPEREDTSRGEPENSPNLILLYSLIALALALAIGFAALIVLPFYRSR